MHKTTILAFLAGVATFGLGCAPYARPILGTADSVAQIYSKPALFPHGTSLHMLQVGSKRFYNLNSRFYARVPDSTLIIFTTQAFGGFPKIRVFDLVTKQCISIDSISRTLGTGFGAPPTDRHYTCYVEKFDGNQITVVSKGHYEPETYVIDLKKRTVTKVGEPLPTASQRTVSP